MAAGHAQNRKQARDEARDMQRGKPEVQLIASDIDPQAIKLSEQHAKEASVSGDIQFCQLDVLEMKPNRDYGVIICNPPYGERMGDGGTTRKPSTTTWPMRLHHYRPGPFMC